MLVLDSHQVADCRVSSRKHPEGFAGASYRNLLFVKARSFPSSEQKQAIQLCREGLERGHFCILIRDRAKSQYCLCYQVKSKTEPAIPAVDRPTKQSSSGDRTILQPPTPEEDFRRVRQRIWDMQQEQSTWTAERLAAESRSRARVKTYAGKR